MKSGREAAAIDGDIVTDCEIDSKSRHHLTHV